MNGKCLLDTNIVIALYADDATVKDNLAKAEQIFVPSIVIGELCFGAQKSKRVKENLERIDEFVASSVVLGCDDETARQYGEIKNALRIKGRPIPENDIWIAAIARQHDLALTTRDTHFNEIENIRVIIW
jgi:tRNA(fMet)-specific endonuclease VapC